MPLMCIGELIVGWLGAKKPGRVVAKVCTMACSHWFESWNSMAMAMLMVCST